MSNAEKAPNHRTVLIVDDDADCLLQERIHMEALGFTVETAESRADAETRLKSLRPDLAIVDLMMEDMDSGFTLCHHIKQLDADIPVIIVTAVTSETGMLFDKDQGAGAWVKADAVLAKPVRPDQLQREINRLDKGD